LEATWRSLLVPGHLPLKPFWVEKQLGISRRQACGSSQSMIHDQVPLSQPFEILNHLFSKLVLDLNPLGNPFFVGRQCSFAKRAPKFCRSPNVQIPLLARWPWTSQFSCPEAVSTFVRQELNGYRSRIFTLMYGCNKK
jgi:hypothetical protein